MKKTLRATLITAVFILLCSCANSEFNDDYRDYKELFISSMDFTESCTYSNQGIIDNLRGIDESILEGNIRILKEKAQAINDSARSGYEKYVASTVKNDCTQLEDLLSIRKTIDDMNDDDEKLLVSLYTFIDANIDQYSGDDQEK